MVLTTPESKQSRKKERKRGRETDRNRSCTVFYELVSEVTYYHSCNILLVTQFNPETVWEGTECEYQETGSLGSMLEAGYHKY